VHEHETKWGAGTPKWNAGRERTCAALFAGLLARARRAFPGCEADALDLVQETMERFLRQFPEALPPAPRCKAWLFQTFDHHVISEWRKRMVRQRALSDPAFELLTMSEQAEPDAERTRVELVMDQLTDEALQEAVRALSPRLRQAFELHLRGLSRRSIALELRITTNAVNKRLFDARQRLRTTIDVGPPRLRGAHFDVRGRPRPGGPALISRR